MPLTDVQIAETIKSTFGYIGQGQGQINAVKVRDAIARKLGVTNPSELNSMLAHVTQSKRLYESGLRLEESTGPAAHDRNLPLDRSFDPSQGRYGYRVLVHVTDPETLTSYTALELVYSDTPLSTDAIRARAFQQWEDTRYDIGTDPKRESVGARVNITAEILSAGRTR